MRIRAADTLKSTAIAIATWMLVSVGGHASAQVYRCGNAYSQRPCEDGKLIDAQAAPSAADTKAAQAQASRNERLANQLEKDRLTQERRVAGPSVVVTGQKEVATKPEAAASKPKSGKKEQAKTSKARKLPADFTAVAPARR